MLLQQIFRFNLIDVTVYILCVDMNGENENDKKKYMLRAKIPIAKTNTYMNLYFLCCFISFIKIYVPFMYFFLLLFTEFILYETNNNNNNCSREMRMMKNYEKKHIMWHLYWEF